jgi:hypothetical protein
MRRRLLVAVPVIVGIVIVILAAQMMMQSEQIQRKAETERAIVDNEPNGPTMQYETRTITMDDVHLTVEIADDTEKITRGLMFREHLPDDRGMLFLFERERPYTFWMMNMKINLDIIWLNSDGKVVHIVENAQPCVDEFNTAPCTYTPDEPAKYVLEVNSGFVNTYGITEDSMMKILT